MFATIALAAMAAVGFGPGQDGDISQVNCRLAVRSVDASPWVVLRHRSL